MSFVTVLGQEKQIEIAVLRRFAASKRACGINSRKVTRGVATLFRDALES